MQALPPPSLPPDYSEDDSDDSEDDSFSDEDANPQDGNGERRPPEGGQKSNRPKPPKSADKVERDDRLLANYALYEKVSTEELNKILPRGADGGTSIGAILHANNDCAVCLFHHSPKGCYNGVRCKFCHGEHEKPQRRRRAKKEGGEGVDGDNQNGGERRPRKRRRRRSGGDGEGGAREGSPGSQRQPNQRSRQPDTSMILDEAGNSRPCWLVSDPTYGVHVYRPQVPVPRPPQYHAYHYPPALTAHPHGYPPHAAPPPHAHAHAAPPPVAYAPHGYSQPHGAPPPQAAPPPQHVPQHAYPPAPHSYPPAQGYPPQDAYASAGYAHPPAIADSDGRAFAR